MNATPDQVDRWLSAHENARLEFKRAEKNFDNDQLCRYCVALANEGGGHLILGVTNTYPRAVVGTSAISNPDETAKWLFDKLKLRVEIDVIAHRDGRIVVFTTPSRPKGTAYTYDGRYLMRVGENLVSMTEDKLRTIFDEGKPDWLQQFARENLSAQDVIELLDIQTYFELIQVPYPTSQAGVIDRLLKERFVEASQGSFSLRRIGALLLAKRLSDFPELSLKAPRLIVYRGHTKRESKLEQIGQRGYAVGYKGLVEFTMGQLPQNEIIESAFRRETKLVSELVVRELAANALIHQDFAISGSRVMIEIYDDRVEFSNPGLPIVAIDRMIDSARSRNDALADFMRRVHICEERGSGLDRVVEEIEAYQLPALEFLGTNERLSVTVFGHRPFEAMHANERVRACWQHAVLQWVMKRTMTNQSLRERFGLPESKTSTVSQIIGDAVDQGFIKPDVRIGASRKYARYLPSWA